MASREPASPARDGPADERAIRAWPSGGRSDGETPGLIVLCGLPFAGKSTLARDLASRLGMRHVEVDAIVREQGINFGPAPLPREAWVTAYREGHHRLRDLLAGGTPAVWDAVSFRWSHREALRRLATRQGWTSWLVWIAPPAAEIARRRVDNRLVPRRGDVPEAEFAGVAAGFQPPRPDEGATRYDPAMMSVEELIAILTTLDHPVSSTAPVFSTSPAAPPLAEQSVMSRTSPVAPGFPSATTSPDGRVPLPS